MSLTRLLGVLRTRSTAVSVAILATLAYLPALTAAPGRMPTDSKLYVYLNPGRFLSDTTTSFDPRQFAGWVPHQHIAYLWPTAPWFWVFEKLGVPDWIAHRLWIGTLLLLAGLGVRWMSRVLGLAPLAALVAAIVYQLSPYVLPYISRTSVLLLPWAGLGWIVGLTVLASIRGRWRFSAAIALVVLTVGAVNATALAMIIPAPALWLVHAAWQRTITWRRALATAGKVGLLSIAVSLWWMVMLIIQGRRGADVLAYSESLESVSFTSTSTEVLRGLGYWLFYVRNSFAATTTASIDHLFSVKTVLAGFLLLTICLFGLLVSRWQHRRFSAMLVGAGVVLAVGVHPIDNPSPMMSLLLGDGEGGLALALRSSTRAIPVVMLGLALGAASLVGEMRPISLAGSWRFASPRFNGLGGTRSRVALASAIGMLAVYNLPALRNGGFVDPALERDQSPPAAWLDAAEYLDSLPDGYRVLQVPGTEFGAFQWGYTVDQPLPALTERPLLTRDLLPLGSPAAMDLLFALDDRIQDGTIDVASIAPVARLLGVDTVWVSDDIQFDRFRLARPELVDDLLTNDAAGLAGLQGALRFGNPIVMEPQVPYLDEQALGDPRIGQPLSTVSLVGVEDAIPTVRVKDDVIVLSGSGDGVVDAAAAGLIDGSELIRYSASLSETDLRGAIGPEAETAVRALLVTDSNRDRAHHWRSSQDVHGATESGGPQADALRFEPADQRLPVFETSAPETQAIAVQDGPVTARATAYGEPFAYLPEHRPVMAIDGDPETSWLVADRSPAVGELIRLTVQEPIDHVILRQPDSRPGARVITKVMIQVGQGADSDLGEQTIVLTEESLHGVGQRIELPATGAMSRISVKILETSNPQPPVAEAIGAVGFSEIDFGLAPTTEYIRVPTDATALVGADTPTSFVFTRLRSDPQDRFRSDPEPLLRRRFDVPTAATFDATVTLRIPGAASGSTLAELLGEPVVESGHLAGTPSARGAAAFDNDPATSWITPFDEAVGSFVTLQTSGVVAEIEITQPVGNFSPITRIRVSDATNTFEFEVAIADTSIVTPDGVPAASGATTDHLLLPQSLDLSSLTVEILEVDEHGTTDRRFGEPVVLPAAISEITFAGSSPALVAEATLSGECRTDLLSLDGTPVGLSFAAPTIDALHGNTIEAGFCDGPIELSRGTHEITTTPGTSTGFDVDGLVFANKDGAALDLTPTASIDPRQTVVVDGGRHHRSVEVAPCPQGCWLVLGEGFNTGWNATSDGQNLGVPSLVDGNANGWWIEPSESSSIIEIQWTPQRFLSWSLIASVLATLVALALVIADRRRSDDPVRTPLQPTLISRHGGLHGYISRRAVFGSMALPAVSAGALIGWSWVFPAFAISAVGAVLGRPRITGAAGLLIVIGSGLVVTYVVQAERPFPGAGWPIRFEWLHGWTLLGIILLATSTLFSRERRVNV